MATIERSIGLRCTKGTSDKVYYMQLVSMGERKFSVVAQYGKFGAVLRHSFRIEDATYWKANREFENQLDKELKKGYKMIETPQEILMMVLFNFAS